jgi:hypothetical protein
MVDPSAEFLAASDPIEKLIPGHAQVELERADR